MERKYIMQLPRGAKVSSTDIKYEDGKIVLTAQLEEWKPQDGEICLAETFYGLHKFIIIFGHDDYSLNYNVSRKDKWTLKEDCQWSYLRIRPATEEERKKLFDAMAKEGRRWNAEKKVVEDVRWRAEAGEYYYYISGLPDKTPEVSFRQETCSAQDDMDYNRGNYFRTKEMAVIAGNQMIDILKNSKAE